MFFFYSKQTIRIPTEQKYSKCKIVKKSYLFTFIDRGVTEGVYTALPAGEIVPEGCSLGRG